VGKMEKILFSLENCIKCTQTKELMNEREDIEILTYPHEITEWNQNQIEYAKSHNVFEDLKKTAPILYVEGEKKIGYLRIRKWLQDNEK
jgi:glutaredoxin